jgi:hypothetical protein
VDPLLTDDPAGRHDQLDAWDIPALRFGVAGLLLSPIPGERRRDLFLDGGDCVAARNRGSLAGSLLTLRWRGTDSNLYGAFPVKSCFWFVGGSLFGAGKPFFVPSPAIRFAERAEGVKGPKR